MSRLPPHIVIDDFLPASLHDSLLDHALAHEAKFSRTSMLREGVKYRGDERQSWTCDAGLGRFKKPFREAVLAAVPQVTEALNMPAFEPVWVELDLSAHRDGDRFLRHVDTFHSVDRNGQESDRVITMVYYLHAEPRGFTGGEFAIYPFGPGEPVLIEPRDNRLLAIPAFALHEVRPISCPGDEFRSARFAVNSWIHRAHAPAASA